ncbi:type I-E CRISPR-associated protein Cas6/Cse3/CasE [Streptomyces sp. TRM49041]|uniref:type I-E CRISPR-associated protein Cas6/Cse3/CasE n=1 Tax=Streptomyces sp. TRM49041 TaxID=2603216 RepID=UPI0011ED4248|nr:type I-E CRISPR-associated protein Cas6/Cse3/CasE [Streptomyces sp. TRM49041]
MTPTATLVRVQLNPLNRAVQRDLRDATQMHRTLMRLVPDNLGASPRRITSLLYRIDETEHASTLLVQATVPLATDRLPQGYGHAQAKDLSPMFSVLRKDMQVRYRITVNPAKRQRLTLEEKGRRGQIIPLSGQAADDWWTRKALDAGLQLISALPTPQQPAKPQRRSPQPSTMRHSLIRYDGTATVTDPTALTTALLEGIGRGKSYGAGLLSLAPAGTG